MARFWSNRDNVSLGIPSSEQVDAVVFYKIQVKVGEVSWSVLRRYSQFHRLHSSLVVDHGVAKDILPPKKMINKGAGFVDKRRRKLQEYLVAVGTYLKRTMPRAFIEFLDFHVYDVYFLSQRLADLFFDRAESILSCSKSYTFDCLELHAIGDLLRNPLPRVEPADEECNISHTLDFCLQLTHLTVSGIGREHYKNSNIEQSALYFEMSPFKYLKSWLVTSLHLDGVTSLGNLRSGLHKLAVHTSGSEAVSQVLQCDMVHKLPVESSPVWSALAELDLSDNDLTDVDDSIRLVPNVRILKLNHNKISSVPDLTQLANLAYLGLSDNRVQVCEDLHTKLGNVQFLDLSQNNVRWLRGFAKLYSLVTLDLSSNNLCDIQDIASLSHLECLENLRLTGNRVATVVDYRVKVLEHLCSRASFVCLDNEKPTQQELDKASLLRALSVLNRGKSDSHTFSYPC